MNAQYYFSVKCSDVVAWQPNKLSKNMVFQQLTHDWIIVHSPPKSIAFPNGGLVNNI